MVVPVLRGHQGGNTQHRHSQGARRHRIAVFPHPFVQGDDSKANPYRKDIEGAYKSIVAFAGLKGLVVRVNNNC